jgi:alkylation response protein AidB-like acyl-CoA dehydrogenase
MDFSLTEEQEMLRTSARDFLQEKCPKTLVKAMEKDPRGYPPALWKEIAGLGWLGLVFPEQYEGSGMDFVDLAVLMEEAGRACLPGPFFSTVVLGGLTLLDAGTDPQKQTYLPRIARGDAIVTMALTELDAQYAARSMTVRAEPSGKDFVINGAKLFVPDAHVADSILCVTRTRDAAAADDGVSVFLVDAAAPGISHSLLTTMSGDRQCEVVFDHVKVPGDRLVGGLHQGWPIVQRTIERAATAKCCEMVGIMQRALEMTVSYAKERKQSGRPIGSFQSIQHYCANMAADVDGSRFSTYQAAWRISQGLPATREVAIAKAWMNESFGRVITLAHQVHGAIACTIDHELQYYTKRGKAGDLTYGDGDFYRELVAQQMGL